VPVRLQVRVHPGAQRPGLVGRLSDGSLKVAVAEAPEGGRANRAVEVLVARVLSLRRTEVKVVGGAAARLKQIEIASLDAAEIERRIAEALAGICGKHGREASHGK
jgi:uncharacterized protein YggU (UPF0235/DUF167 family)